MKLGFAIIFIFLTSLAVFQGVFVPYQVQAADQSLLLVTCGEGDPTATPLDPRNPSGEKECSFRDVLREIRLLINFLLLLTIPLTTIALTVTGVKILLAQGNYSKITEARKTATKVATGFIIILAAWLIVYTIVSQLLRPEFYNIFIGNPSANQSTNK